MLTQIVPYQMFGPLRFGESRREDCVAAYGNPIKINKSRLGQEQYHYQDFIIRFDAVTSIVRACTLLPNAETTVDDLPITWDRSFLRQGCERDGNPSDVYGFIVLPSLGIAVTGIHDDDRSQMAITVISKDDFDIWSKGKPFRFVEAK